MGRKMVVLVAITVGFFWWASEEELRCLPTSPKATAGHTGGLDLR